MPVKHDIAEISLKVALSTIVLTLTLLGGGDFSIISLFYFEISNLFTEITYVMKMLHYRNAPYITLYIVCVLYITLIKSKMY